MGNTKSEIVYSVPISDKVPGESCIYRHPLCKDSLVITPHYEIQTMQDAILKTFTRFEHRQCLGTRLLPNSSGLLATQGFVSNQNGQEIVRNPSQTQLKPNQIHTAYQQMDDLNCCGGGGYMVTNQTNIELNLANQAHTLQKTNLTQGNQQYFSVSRNNGLGNTKPLGQYYDQINSESNSNTSIQNIVYQQDFGGAKTELERQKRIQQIQLSTNLSFTEKQTLIDIENKKFELQKASILTNGKSNLLGSKQMAKGGEYCWKTYKDLFNTVKNLATGIKSLSLAEQNDEQEKQTLELVGIWSRSREEWVMIDCANVLYNYVTVPIPEQIHASDLSFILEDTQLSSIFCGRNELEKLYRMIRTSQKTQVVMSLGNLQNIICFDEFIPATLQKFFTDQIGLNVITLKFVIDKGAQIPTIPLPKISPDNIISFCYTTRQDNGKPIAAMLSHRNFVSFLASVWNISHLKPQQDDVYLSYLPLSHIYEKVSVFAALYAGASIGFYSGEISTLIDDIFVLRPTIFCSVPSFYNKLYSTVQDKYFKKTEGVERWINEKALEQKLQAHRQSPTADVTHAFYDNVIFKSFRDSLGGRLRLAFSSSAPLFSHVHQTLKLVYGVPIVQAYGCTQSTGLALITNALDSSEGHVGGPTLNTGVYFLYKNFRKNNLIKKEFKIIDVLELGYTNDDIDETGQKIIRGELCLRGPGIFEGYFREQEQTSKEIDKNGWLHTGDIVQLTPNGSIKIIDNKKNIFKMPQGEYVSPEKLERIYQQLSSITDICIYGSPIQKYLVAVVVPKKDVVDQVAKEYGLPTSSYIQNCRHPQVKVDIISDIQKLAQKQKLFSYEIVQKIHIETTPFSILGLVTPSNQLKRQQAYKLFKQGIDSLYEFDN